MFNRRWWLVVGICLLAAISLLTLPYGLPNDIRYEIGAKEVSPYGPAGTFTHRPLLYRLITSLMVAVVDLVANHRSSFEIGVRSEAVLLAAAASLVLWLGLRRYAGSSWPAGAVGVAVAVFGAQVLMNPAFTLEPEWLATTLTVAGVGAALAFRRTWAGSVAGGILLAAATAVKIISLPIALIGLIAVLLLDRRRALGATIAAAVSGGLFLLGLALFFPREITWLFDIQTVQPLVPSLGTEIGRMATYLVNVVVMWPVLALLPAALLATRWTSKVAVAAALALGWLPAQIQQHFYIYHAAPLPVLGAAVIGAAAARRLDRVEAIALIVISVWTGVLLSLPKSIRVPYAPVWFALTLAIGAVAWWWRRRTLPTTPLGPVDVPTKCPPAEPQRWYAGLLTGGLVAITMVGVCLPMSAESLSLPASSSRNEHVRDVAAHHDVKDAKRIHERIGTTTPVTYLTFGDIAYFLKNPATCRYPSPVFLQRDTVQHDQESTMSWHEAELCLTRPGRWLVWDTGWFQLEGQPPVIVDAIRHNFNCKRGFRAGKLEVCPRR